MNDWRCEIEQDGPRYRWILMEGDHRRAKAARWWDTEVEAELDYDYFCDCLRGMDERP